MPSTSGMPVFTLNLYQGYQCRHSGICCTAGWDIPIDDVRLVRLEEALARETLRLPDRPGPAQGVFVRSGSLPDGAAAIITNTPSGECAFFDRPAGRLCAVHRELGHAWLPGACRHFPRIILLDDQGAYVAFSHVCPTAADMLVRDDVDRLAVVTDASVLVDSGEVEGFDARGAVPPFNRPRTVLDPEGRHAWEAFLLTACSRTDETPWCVIARLATGAERLRAWTPARGAMGSFARDVLNGALEAEVTDVSADAATVMALYAQVMRTVPAGLVAPTMPDGARLVENLWCLWPAAWRPVNRYLGSRAFGAWSAYRGRGVRTQVAVLAAALAVLSLEVIRRVGPDGTLDAAGLRDALGAADLLTVHQSNDEEVCAALGRAEALSSGEFLASLGLAAL